MEAKRFFQRLDEMNVSDIENNSRFIEVCPNLVSADYSEKLKGTKITMGSPGNVVFDIQTNKKIPLLILVNKEEYDRILEKEK